MKLLSKEACQTIHEASIEILQKIGVRILDGEMLAELSACGFKVNGDRVFINEQQVLDSIKSCPKKFKLHARNPANDIEIGEGSWKLCSGYGCTAIIEPGQSRRPAQMSDYLRFTKWSHTVDEISVVGGAIVQPADLPAHGQALMIAAASIYSDKCIMGVPSPEPSLNLQFSLFKEIFGIEAFRNGAHSIFLINTSSPLALDKTTCSAISACARESQAMIITPGPMTGATAPITVAGTIAQGNAEALAVIAIVQALSPNTPVIYGLHPTVMDLRSGAVSIGSPVFNQLCMASIDIAHYYGLPCRGPGAVTDAHGVGVQSGYESMQALQAGALKKADFVLHAAGILNSYGAMSYEKYIADIAWIRSVVRQNAQIDLSEDKLALEAIEDAATGDENFLSHDHTILNCRKESFKSLVASCGPPKKKGAGLECELEQINIQAKALDEAYAPPEDSLKIVSLARELFSSLGFEFKIN